MRHVDHLLGVELVNRVGRGGHLIRDYVVDVVSAHRTAKPHKRYRDRGWPQTENIVSFSLCPPVQVKQNVDIFLVDEACQLCSVGPVRNLVEFVTVSLYLLAVLRPVTLAEAESNNRELGPVMELENRLEQVGKRVVGEVPRHVSYSYPKHWRVQIYFLVRKRWNFDALSVKRGNCVLVRVV